MLPESAIIQYQTKMMNSLFIETIGHPRGTAVDRLIAELSKQNDISYIYVTHDV